MNHKQLTFAREYRGYSQTELADSIKGLSQSNLSRFEKGFGVLSDDIQRKIIEYLNFPEEFFNRKINSTIENANYRKRASIGKNITQRFENKCKLIGYIIDEFSESIEWLDFTLSPLNVEEGYTPQYIANYNRKLLKLTKDEPVKNIMSLLEQSGVIIYEIDEIEKFDGVSFITDKGFPVIIVNKNFSNDRKRFTIAHELGHILLHNENLYPISSYRDKEKEANIFASEFLMPEDEIKNSLRQLKMSDLGDLKSYWLTSMSSVIRKAKDLNFLDDNRYRYFMIEMSRYGYNKKEPIEVFIDKPTCFKNAYQLFKNEFSYDINDFVKFTALPKDILDDILFFERTIKLKVLKP
ncbi:MAG: ImmA/IrrE family metallo-endopeptidase [Paludibacter sp.]|jgi:Zn-dependent peptidase ImmA (M78 family)|nr:ImmA/IrrE family metallo-endopeptidase [Paludibacter sp.]